MIYLLFRFLFAVIGVMLVLSFLVVVFTAWALMWIVVFVASAFYVAFDEKRKPKRLKPPSIPQSRWSSRR